MTAKCYYLIVILYCIVIVNCDDVTVPRGGNVTLRCDHNQQGGSVENVVWYYLDTSPPEAIGYWTPEDGYFEVEGTQWSGRTNITSYLGDLFIEQLSVEDEGRYRCECNGDTKGEPNLIITGKICYSYQLIIMLIL